MSRFECACPPGQRPQVYIAALAAPYPARHRFELLALQPALEYYGSCMDNSDFPRLLVVALVFIRQQDAILLVKQNYGAKYWSLTGGIVEPDESFDQAAMREVREETGLEVRIRRVVGLYSKPDEGALAITFDADVISGSLKPPTDEIAKCQYFPLDHLPPHVRSHLRQRVKDYRQNLPGTAMRTQ
jgi:ADP-ribose pyrophosphatase YjhB (NUDIX family)